MERSGAAQSRAGAYKLAVVTPFRLRHLPLDTLREHVIFIHEHALRSGDLGLHPLDRARVFGVDRETGKPREITGVLNVCSDKLLEVDEIGVSEEAFRDLGLPEGAAVGASFAVAPASVDLVRAKLRGKPLRREDFDAILTDVAARRYSRVELSMFVLGCAFQKFDLAELTDYTLAMIATGEQLRFAGPVVADKHCIGGVPGNRTTMIVVPILAELGLRIPKTSSRAITSPAGTGDTMAVLADVALSAERLYRVVEEVGGCIAWGGALELAPADDILITVERPMEIDDREAQMVASILAKKKTAGATHVLIDIPVGSSAKVKTPELAEHLATLFKAVGERIGLRLEIVTTQALGPVGYGIGPRLEALDVLSVLRCEPSAPVDLREKSLVLAGRLLEMTGVEPPSCGYEAARRTLDSGAALRRFDRIVDAQGRREMLAEARWRRDVAAGQAGRITEIDCWQISRVAKRAGAPSNASAGVRLYKSVGDTMMQGEPIFEIHAESDSQLQAALEYQQLGATSRPLRRRSLSRRQSFQAIGFADSDQQVVGLNPRFGRRDHFEPLVVALHRHDPKPRILPFHCRDCLSCRWTFARDPDLLQIDFGLAARHGELQKIHDRRAQDARRDSQPSPLVCRDDLVRSRELEPAQPGIRVAAGVDENLRIFLAR